MRKHGVSAVVFVSAIAWSAVAATAQPKPFYRQGMPLAPGSGGDVGLPYAFADGAGNLWRIHLNGWFQQEGNSPLIHEGALLFVNGNSPWKQDSRARLDPATGELVVEMQANGLNIIRRIFFNKRQGLIRYIDVVQNPLGTAQTATISITSNLNSPLAAGQFIADARKKDQNVAWVGRTPENQALLELYGGAGAPVATVLDWTQGNRSMTVTAVLNLPPKRELAVMHLHKLVPSMEAGAAYMKGFNEAALLKVIPTALRRSIVNFPVSQAWLGDIELPRGEFFDGVDLRNGDQFRGTVKDTTFVLQTFHGPLELPADAIAGIISLGEAGARQLVVSTDGQVFAGRLEKKTLDLQLPGGQVTPIPFSQVSRVAWRKRPGEPDEATSSGKPLALLTTGERMFIKPLTEHVGFATRYGRLALKPEVIAAISFENEEPGIHEITLTDGSKLSGLAADEQIEVVLETGGKRAKLAVNGLARLQLAAKMPEVADLAPRLQLVDGDLLVGRVTGKLHIEMSFDTIEINTENVRLLTREKGETHDVRAILWDHTSFSGRLTEPELNCELKSGVVLKAPVVLLLEYSQPPKTHGGKSGENKTSEDKRP